MAGDAGKGQMCLQSKSQKGVNHGKCNFATVVENILTKGFLNWYKKFCFIGEEIGSEG